MSVLDKFKDLYTFKSIIGLEVSLDSANSYIITRVQKQNNVVTIEYSKEYSSLEEVNQYTNGYKNSPISLLLSAKGVLIKSILNPDKAKDLLTDQEIRGAFPSYTKEEYYISQFKGAQHIWLAIVKRSLLDDLLSELEQRAIKPIQVFIGPFLFSNILQQLNVYSETYVFAKHHIEIDSHGNWQDYHFSSAHINKFKLKVGDRLIKQEYLPSYAAAFSTLMHDYLANVSLELSQVAFLFTEEKEKIKFRIHGILLLSTLFILLLFNMILFNTFYQKNQQLQSNLNSQSISDKQYEEINKLNADNETLIRKLGWNGGLSQAILLERIGLSLQDFPTISLSKIAVNPIIEQKIAQQTIENNDYRNTIRISGHALSLEGLHAWLKSLNKQEWINNVHISKFGKSEGYEETDYLFNLEIIFNHEF